MPPQLQGNPQAQQFDAEPATRPCKITGRDPTSYLASPSDPTNQFRYPQSSLEPTDSTSNSTIRRRPRKPNAVETLPARQFPSSASTSSTSNDVEPVPTSEIHGPRTPRIVRDGIQRIGVRHVQPALPRGSGRATQPVIPEPQRRPRRLACGSQVLRSAPVPWTVAAPGR